MRKETRTPRVALWVLLLWSAFVVRGVWYCAMLPAWEGYDEPFHFAVLQHVSGGQGMPRDGALVSLEVQKSLHLLPLPWELHFHSIPGPLTSHEDFWRLPPAEREARIAAVHELAPQDGSQAATEPIVNYESQQPPLYYWIFALPMRWMSGLSLLSRLYALRILNVLLASAAIPLAYFLARLALNNERQALGVSAIVVLLPELMINVARVSNESLALVCYTVMLLAAIMVTRKPWSWRAWLLLGAPLGCGLLTKAYVLSAVPAVVLLPFVVLRSRDAGEPRVRPGALLIKLGTALGVAVVIAGGWYRAIHAATGSWTGVKDDVAVSHLSFVQKLAQVAHVDWRSGVLSIAISHVWFGAWSFLRVPNAICVVVFAVAAVAAVGVVLRLRRSRPSQPESNAMLVLAAFYLCFWAGLLYDVLAIFIGKGVSASAGWYLYAAVGAEVILLVWGLQAFVPARVVYPCLAIGAGVLDLFGANGLMMPYYAGLTVHDGKWVPSAFGQMLTQLHLVMSRFGELRPGWLSVTVLLCLWIAYWLATLGAMLASLLLFRPASAES